MVLQKCGEPGLNQGYRSMVCVINDDTKRLKVNCCSFSLTNNCDNIIQQNCGEPGLNQGYRSMVCVINDDTKRLKVNCCSFSLTNDRDNYYYSQYNYTCKIPNSECRTSGKIVNFVLEFTHLSLQLRLFAVPHWIMEKILIRYEGNGSSRYDKRSICISWVSLQGLQLPSRREIVPCVVYFCMVALIICLATWNSSAARTLATLP